MAKKTLIVYVHGALSSKRSWSYVRSQLEASQLEHVVEEAFEYNISTTEAEKIVESSVTSLRSWLKKHKPEKLVLVGHSFGGLIVVSTARHLKKDLDSLGIEVKLFTSSSPFAGSGAATILRFFKPSSIFFKNISSYDSFIREFKRHALPYKTHIIVTSGGGADWINEENDGVVTLDSQLYFKGDPLAKHEKVPVNHFEVLLSEILPKRLAPELSVA
jgi:pimeloyl-ACP methyl ester carboxylesterase